jgi:hypothetical protein
MHGWSDSGGDCCEEQLRLVGVGKQIELDSNEGVFLYQYVPVRFANHSTY